MDFFSGIVALLALVVMILTVLIAWLYAQQARLMQAVSALTAAITTPPPTFFEAMKEFPIAEEEEKEAVIDDRVSVHEEEEEEQEQELEVEEQDENTDDIGSKTIAQLRELLNGKGIPFNKSDKKPVLVNLLKAAS